MHKNKRLTLKKKQYVIRAKEAQGIVKRTGHGVKHTQCSTEAAVKSTRYNGLVLMRRWLQLVILMGKRCSRMLLDRGEGADYRNVMGE